jgi:hypothetical protein
MPPLTRRFDPTYILLEFECVTELKRPPICMLEELLSVTDETGVLNVVWFELKMANSVYVEIGPLSARMCVDKLEGHSKIKLVFEDTICPPCE